MSQSASVTSKNIISNQAMKFNVIELMSKWIERVSKFWEQKMPNEILELYTKLFVSHLNHLSLPTWNLLNESEFQAVFRMTLFYLELSHEEMLKTVELNVKK